MLETKMAEAAVENPHGTFYCHQCSAEITPKIPEYICPRCNSGFIEEVTVSASSGPTPGEPSPQSQAQDAAAQFAEMWTQALLSSTFGPMQLPGGAVPRPAGGAGGSGPGDPRPGPSGHTSVQVVRTGRNPYMEGLINYFLTRLGGDAMQGIPVNMFQLHGNPADYAWGAGGLDSIITQLLNQLENSGPPPADHEKVEALPTVEITQEQVDKTMQCSVCMEDFVLGEKVRRLPCEHHYHNGCILPWLELHGTCPVCRKDLNGQDTSTVGSDPPFPSPDGTLPPPNSSRPGGSASSSSTETNPSLD
ncbi:E3 ubiquitin-protein ligase RNF115-like [Babylonia areolata]|uniref:E3 ubiquitin-protein ligase RNF115-like n=1 Tax=Babylonia areolata TaxID=304850 RepID=UPI003FD4F4BC